MNFGFTPDDSWFMIPFGPPSNLDPFLADLKIAEHMEYIRIRME